MSPAASNSMAALLSPLLNSFQAVPPAAIPPMLDCILASSAASPSLLFDFLLKSFSDHIKHIGADNEKLGLDECNVLVAYLRALSHLFKNSGVDDIAFQSFISKVFVPLMKTGHLYGRETLTEIQESFLEIVTLNNNWAVVEETLVPFLLRSVASTMDLHPSNDTTIMRWSRHLVSSDLESTVLPLSLSCHILSSLLGVAMHADQSVRSTLEGSVVGESRGEKLVGTMMSDLCNMTIRMLLHSSEHRTCAVGLLFPTILDAFASKSSFEISVHGETHSISRNYFFMKTWECCKSLFSLGPVERRDAYGILSLYLSYLPCVDGSEVEVVHRAEGFTIITEKEFWDEIIRGLVDREGLVRKQSLHILKKTMLMKEDTKSISTIPEKKSCKKSINPSGMKKRDLWAEEEALSLGVGQVCSSVDPSLAKLEKWQAFLLLYEMLEEYGTHLVEAAWDHQIALLLSPPFQEDESLDFIRGVNGRQQENSYMNFCWLAILWERGLFHDNPHVRCLIMQSFLGIEWKKQGNIGNLFPEGFLLGPFIEGLNDPVHHKDFGLKGFYSSKTIEGASSFLHHYCSFFSERKRISFLCKLASVGRHQSLGRVGLVAVAECISSASLLSTVSLVQSDHPGSCEVYSDVDAMLDVKCTDKTYIIDSLRFLMEISKQHFNSNYRLRVCEKVLQAAVSVVCSHELPLEMLFLFVAALPREFTDNGGPLRNKVHVWLAGCGRQTSAPGISCNKMHLLQNLLEFPSTFSSYDFAVDSCGHYDDEDLVSWGAKSERWARVLFLQITEGQQLEPLFMFLKDRGITIRQQTNCMHWIPAKFLVIILSLVHELEIMQRKAEQGLVFSTEIEPALHEHLEGEDHGQMSCIFRYFANNFLLILKDLTSFAASSCSIFWSSVAVSSMELPGAVTGRLGGPSQRRLPSSITTIVLQAITSMKTVACLSSWFLRSRMNVDVDVPITFLWEFFWKVVSSSIYESEAGSEIHVAAYEVLSSILMALAPVCSPSMINIIVKTPSLVSTSEKNVTLVPILDSLVYSFLEHSNKFIASGVLARTRIAVLLNWKWSCLESLLSIPYHAHRNRVQLECSNTFFSGEIIKYVFDDLVESLENAGEDSVLPMLKSIRYVMDMLTNGGPFVSEHDGVDVQMMWRLVRSSWILHTSCNKRRVAPIAALLSSVLHASVFRDEKMHVVDDVSGPLKWFCGKVLEEGTKSPRTFRLAALHLTGLWLLNPRTIKHYLNELKLLTLYGSVAFDEDFESELTENGAARSEVALLAKSSDPEMTEIFINTELYARVSVAVLFHKLAQMVSRNNNDDCHAALESGKLFLLELLDSVVNDKDLSKELYKKHSAIHRRKVRVWQMVCVLSRFVDKAIVDQVAESLHIAIQRNNMPSVRQYMETFAINLFLRFPHLVGQQLVPILRDYDMKTQALSSYVFVAANLILHAEEAVQSQHLETLLPPIVPFLTSHHHTLRGFTQLLVHKVLSKEFPDLSESCFAAVSLEKKCLLDLKSYLSLNPDCLRLRCSMERFLDTFSPEHSITPSGIFSNRIEALEFECVPMSLMEQVVNFLNDARDDLRHAMANDEVSIKNENLKSSMPPNCTDNSINEKSGESLACPPSDISLDFQRKFTLWKHEMENNRSGSFLDHLEIYKPLAELEKEDKLLVQMMQSRVASMEKLNTSRQQLILVASLIDRIPNLAGLARTCEVFKATSLAIADTSVLNDRQFQLISVTAEKWIPIIEVPADSVKTFLEKKKREGFSVLGLEQTANSVPLDKFNFPKKTVLVLGREKEGIPVDVIHSLDSCIEIPQLGVVRSLNVHVSGAIALWEYTRQQRSKQQPLAG